MPRDKVREEQRAFGRHGENKCLIYSETEAESPQKPSLADLNRKSNLLEEWGGEWGGLGEAQPGQTDKMLQGSKNGGDEESLSLHLWVTSSRCDECLR